ncbi:MAG: carboxymuconolactone decarboxylase family protein [Dermatophilaceae bacterium]
MKTPAHLATLGMLTSENAPAGSRELLDEAQAQLGMVPNMYAEMANSPGLLSTYRFGYDQFRRHSGFNPSEQETIFLAISRFNGCEYCVGAHSAIADGNKVPTEITDAVRAGEPIGDDRLQALNVFTTTMVDTRGRPSDIELKEFLAAGYTEKQALEVVLAISVKTLSNYLNHLFDTPLDKAFSRRAWVADPE